MNGDVKTGPVGVLNQPSELGSFSLCSSETHGHNADFKNLIGERVQAGRLKIH